MASNSLFKSWVGRLMPKADAINSEAAIAYKFDPKHALAQHAATGCLNGTFYAGGESQLDAVLALCGQVEPEFIARTALYARSTAHMKDLPALLCAVLSVRSPGLLAEVFDRVIDSPRMLRNFAQIIRSGAVGRKSLGSLPKRLIQQWIEGRTDEQLFTALIGQDPSLADIVKMVHPKPGTESRAALFAYLIGRSHESSALPACVQEYEAYKAAADRRELKTPDVPFEMLTSLDLGPAEWKVIARNAPWQMTRMNLNTFARHGVFQNAELTGIVSARLRDEFAIRKARALPYQLMVAYSNAVQGVPHEVREALQDAMEIAVSGVPKIGGKVYVFPDVSGSMQSPITGYRRGSTSVVKCVDVAALVASAILRNNPTAEVIPFESRAILPHEVGLNPRDSIMTNARKLSSLPQGGTNCSAPLAVLNKEKATGDLIVYVSDNESWVDSPAYGRCGGSATETMKQWAAFKQRSPRAKMICIDLQPNSTTQAKELPDIVNVGGFSDQVFHLIAAVANGEANGGYWVRQIEAVNI